MTLRTLLFFLALNIHHFFFLVDFLWKEDEAGFSTFLKRADTRLPKYKTHFHEAAQDIYIHWTLIAAISYQESHWNPKAISNTGVR